MNEASYKKLSLLLKKYCPGFIEDRYPGFISFLKAYYDWSMSGKGYNPWKVISNLENWSDIDTTIDEFMNYFKSQYLNSLNVDFNGDIRNFIKHSKEFYSSRGTPESFRFLLRLLSGNEGTIFYPNQYLFKSSDGEWVKDKVIFLHNNDTITNEYVSTVIRGKYSGITATVEKIETHFNYITQEEYLKVYVSDLVADFDNEPILFSLGDGFVECELYSTIREVYIESPGNNYRIDDTLRIKDDPTFMGRVTSIKTGKLDSYVIFDGGSGYKLGEELIITSNSLDYYYSYPRVFIDGIDENGAITSLDIRYAGYGFYEVPVLERIVTDEGSGAVISFISDDAGSINSVEVVSAEINYVNDTEIEIFTESGQGGLLYVKTGNVFTSIPYYYKPGSFLSDEFKLQDSDYWQEYSYEIRSSLTLETELVAQFSEYKDIFRSLVHPTGFKLFNSFILSNHIDLYKRYVNSTIDTGWEPTFVEFVNVIEMISHWNRILDHDIIFQERFTQIADVVDTKIDAYKRIGGEYVRSTIATNT